MEIVKSGEIIPPGMETCVFCQGTLIAHFVDMEKVPVGTSMTMGDDTWKSFEEAEDCFNCNGMGFKVIPESNIHKQNEAIRIIKN